MQLDGTGKLPSVDGSALFNVATTTATTATTAGSFTCSLSGDVAGTQGSTSVTKIQGRSVASTVPSASHVLTWDGSAWSPNAPASATATSLLSKSADYTITAADAGKYLLVSGNNPTMTLPSAASAGSGFTVSIKSSTANVTYVVPAAGDRIEGELAVKIRLSRRAVVRLASDGSAWYVTDEIGTVGRHLPCGRNCYQNTTALNWGYAYTASGKYLSLRNGLWVESDGVNVLRADGSDNWQTFSVTYHANGGSSPPVDSTAYLATAVVTAAAAGSISRTGYTFAAWNTLSDGTGIDYPAGSGSFTMGGADRTLYARWTINTYTVTYDGNGQTSGSVPSSASAAFNSVFTVAANSGNLAKTGGYTFAGCNTQANGNGTNYAAGTGSFSMGAGNMTLYAKWGPAVICGDTTANNCYSGTNAASLQAAGSAQTLGGRSLTWNSLAQVWVESGSGTRVLAVDGSDAWHMQLAGDGRSSTTTPLDKANVAGRACPGSVFVSNADMVASGRCLYYDAGNAWQRLDAPNNDGVTTQTSGSYRLGYWSTNDGGNWAGSSWYEGNIQTCANKGMRLPTLYEITTKDPGNSKPMDATPTWSGTRVPEVGGAWTWTASAVTGDTRTYWIQSGTLTSSSGHGNHNAVRCVAQ